MNRNFANALASSTMLREENIRWKPLTGLSLSKFGARAWKLMFQPPMAMGARNAATNVRPRSGAQTRSACISSLAKIPRARDSSTESSRESDRPARMRSWSCVPRRPPMKCRPPPASNMTAAALSSMERGTCPCSRACSNRLLVGCSVFSWPFSPSSAMTSAPGQHADQHEGFLQQTREARLHGRQAHEDDDEAEDQRNRQANSKQVQGRRGAAHDAERDIHDEQRGHAGQRDTQCAGEQRRAPLHDRPQAVRAETARADRQSAEAIDENLYQPQVAVQGQESHRYQERVELPHYRGLRAVQRVEVVGE